MTPPTTFRTDAQPASVSQGFGDSEIHVWKSTLDVSDAQLEAFARTLGPDEQERIGRLRAESDRIRATASRGLLRHILADYTGRQAAELSFTYGQAGKPELPGTADSARLYFNTAHSGDLLLVAVGRAPFLGVDVERIRPVARWDRVAQRAFSEGELRGIEAFPRESREEAFITCWTRKEACVKAIGEGVWSAFSRFEVSVEPGEPARVRLVDGDEAAAANWSLYHLEPAPGFVGALAVQGTGWRLRTGTLQTLEGKS
ncbi:MAG: 4'-phosphopantetheinyl transferase superfamily protein [marine benthic group bacterium]|nr:4'-phosphopantetheinyl transferase superfamily protein [Gemmatimonadota bacterium]